MSARQYDICATVVSDLAFDARVWKEARSLAAAGYRVALIGCRYDIERSRWRTEGDVDVFEVPLGSRTSPSARRRIATLLRLWSEVLRTRALAYHAHNIHVAPPVIVASLLRGMPVVYDAHELYGEPHRKSLSDKLAGAIGGAGERLLMRRSSGVITTNESRANILTERHDRHGIVVLENVPFLQESFVPLDPGYPVGRRIMLYQGGIYAEGRAFHQTIKALKLLDDDVDFVVLGFGRKRDIELLRIWAAEEGVAERLHLLPARPFDQLVRTAAAATVGIVPILPLTLSTFTGDTNKLFEYLMGGLPVVGSDLPEIARVLHTGTPCVGEVFDPESPSSIAAAVRRVLDDPCYAKRRNSARRLAVERYNWQAQEPRLLQLYAKLLPQGEVRNEHRLPRQAARGAASSLADVED